MVASFKVQAGVVRTIKTNDKKMNTIHLKMGQSTVLRFKDHRPKKIVIGNQNYYNIEFVEGTNDVTLQPLSTVPTNLFVYCQKHTYGFLLNTRNTGRYDDLVNIKWKESPKKIKVNGKLVQRDKAKIKRLKKSLKFSNYLLLSNFRVTSFKNNKKVIVDFHIKNVSKSDLNLKNFGLFATRSNKELPVQDYAIEKDEILSFETIKARFVTNLEKKRGFTLNTSYLKQRRKLIINKRYFK